MVNLDGCDSFLKDMSSVFREEPLMIWGGLRQKRGKKLNGYSLRKKKTAQRKFSARGPPPRSLMVRPLGDPRPDFGHLNALLLLKMTLGTTASL